jgi:phosphatidylserine/phosphatidylglycerophosphate/cardiolipin synthase-like enzyme
MKYSLNVMVLCFLFCSSSLVYADSKVYFSPNGGAQDAVTAQIAKAQRSIDIAMYSFTSREIAQALVEAKKRQVKVRVVLDNAQIKEQFSKSRYLIGKGINVKFRLGPGLMHNKFAVIDGRVLLTGSFNWTASADKKNAENLLIITNKELAQKYLRQFKLLWSQSGEGVFKAGPSED